MTTLRRIVTAGIVAAALTVVPLSVNVAQADSLTSSNVATASSPEVGAVTPQASRVALFGPYNYASCLLWSGFAAARGTLVAPGCYKVSKSWYFKERVYY